MPPPTPIIQAAQLLVEGRDAEVFFLALLKSVGIQAIQVQNFGGNSELRGFLKALRDSPGFRERVLAIGIARDAEKDAKAAFQSVCGALNNSDLVAPGTAEKIEGTEPAVGVLILPNARSPGMLETLCLESVRDDPAMICVAEYLRCLGTSGRAPFNPDKARLHAFLASRPKPDLLLGEAASAGYFDWYHPAFEGIKSFLIALAEHSTSAMNEEERAV